MLALVLVLSTVLVVVYKKLEGNIHQISDIGLGKDRPKKPKVTGPKEPLNVLIMGSDDRKGTNIGGATPGLSDTTILLHLSADRKRAYGVSIPRDAMVERPTCLSKNGKKELPGGIRQFNAAFAVGGPTCTVRTVEHLTNISIDHFVVVNFAGFKDMVNAVHGVTVCVPTEVNDDVGHIHLPEGTYKVNGNQALDYVRVRHDLGAPTGDLGRMKRQQAFISAMISKVYSAGTLTNPVRLYKFLDAATSSLSTDSGFAHLKDLASLGSSLKGIGLEQDPVHHRAQPALPRGHQPARVRTGCREPVAQDPLRQAARQARRRRPLPGQRPAGQAAQPRCVRRRPPPRRARRRTPRRRRPRARKQRPKPASARDRSEQSTRPDCSRLL